MDIWNDILSFSIPALIVFLAVFLVIRRFFKHEEEVRRYQTIMSNQKVTVPLRFRAYERIILFLERMSPDTLVIRHQTPEMTSMQLLVVLQNAIREEYEHNLSQQLYVSTEAWNMVKSAKEGMMKHFNSCATKLDPKSSAFELSKLIIETYHNIPNPPTKTAIAFIKKEIQSFF